VPSKPYRPLVLIADDDEAICTAVTRLLSPDCDVMGRVVDVAAVFEAVARRRPDVVLLDFSLPGELNGLDVCRRLKTMAPGVSVLAFTANDDETLKIAAHDAGFSGFIWKLDVAAQLLPAIYAVVDRTARTADGDAS
jgi:two-component system, OmpR family, response regulator MprA